MKHFIWTTLALIALAFGPVSRAEIIGAESDSSNIGVGVSNVQTEMHEPGFAGIGVYALGTDTRADFKFLKNTAAYTSNGVHTAIPMPKSNTAGHKDIGVFTFAQAGSADVWYGEWSQGGDPHFDNRAVYYAGDDDGTLMPISGSVEYTVKGIHRFTGENDANGSFTADFDAGRLTGSINNGNFDFGVNADISGNAFAGSFFVLDHNTGAILAFGTTQGHFFGTDAGRLAGITNFTGSDSQYNIAFGGSY